MGKEYKVIKFFTDLQDGDHPYKVGDKYPRDGVTVSEERIKELSTPFNVRNEVLIEEVIIKPNRTKREDYDDD